MLRPMKRRSRFVVALSGGVDSATCAGLLVEAGHEVIGISMSLYNAHGTAHASPGRCCGPRDVEDARAVCTHLDIPFYIVDYEDLFQQTVIDDFVSTYQRGQTPNPCVRCNEQVKFLPLLERARALSAQALVTGHYARIESGPQGSDKRLLRGVDPNKDQSYFLFSMPRDALDFVQFPLGGLRKDEVREHARRLGLPVCDKPESQEICFVPDGDYARFVERKTGLLQVAAKASGDIVDQHGHVLGQHPGVHHFTIGQRRGLGFGTGQPQYVVSIDALRQRVVVGPKASLYASVAYVQEVRWLAPPTVTEFSALVQIRSRRAAAPATVTLLPDRTAFVRFDTPELAVTPGQAAVFYRDDQVLGGGFLDQPRSS